MPIYEFYCPDCNVIFSFLSRSVTPSKRPACPRCGRKKLERQVSLFAATGRAKEEGGEDKLPFDADKMERAVESLAGEAEHINEDDPRQAANLMRKLTGMTGMELGPGMKEALERMEKGEDPESIEAEMGDRLEHEDPFLMPEKGKQAAAKRRPAPSRDSKLYDL